MNNNQEKQHLCELATLKKFAKYQGKNIRIYQNIDTTFPDAEMYQENKRVLVELTTIYPTNKKKGSVYEEYKNILSLIETDLQSQGHTGCVHIDASPKFWKTPKEDLTAMIKNALFNGSYTNKWAEIVYCNSTMAGLKVKTMSCVNSHFSGVVDFWLLKRIISEKEKKLNSYISKYGHDFNETCLILEEEFEDGFILEKLPFETAFDIVVLYSKEKGFVTIEKYDAQPR